jgi:hypothetical protein
MSDQIPATIHFERRLEAGRRLREAEAVDMERRLESMNELRARINNERGTFVELKRFNTLCGKLEERVSGLWQSRAAVPGWVAAIVAVGAILNLTLIAIGLWLRK